MKKINRLAMAATVAAVASLGTQAQLVINQNGNAHLGDTAIVDTTATLHIAGSGSGGSHGLVAFGNMHTGVTAVSVGEHATASEHDTDRLWLHGRNGLVVTANNPDDVMFRLTPSTPAGASFATPVSARSTYIATDPRLNATSTAVSTALETLQGLDAIAYRLQLPTPAGEGIIIGPNSGGQAGTNGGGVGGYTPGPGATTRDSLHYGLSLASVQDVLPQLVIEDTDGIRYVDYNSIVSLLVVAVNELKGQVDALTAQLDGTAPALYAPARAPQPATGLDDVAAGLAVPALHQNIPNPFSADTHIRCTLPESVVQADLYVYDLQGHQVKRIAVEQRGDTSVTIAGSELQAGMYIYTLIADGREVDSKRMILTK